jgi:large subunit ribosomal protein L4
MNAMEIPHYQNGQAGRIDVDPSFLGEKVKRRTLFASVIMYEANRRVGTHDTLTRGEVARSKRQLFQQKGTGRARVRHPQVTQCRGGGIAHGPHPRDYRYALPRKELKVALRSALLSKFRDGQVALVDRFDLPAPKTKDLARVLRTLGCAKSALIVTAAPDKNLVLSARNLPRVKVTGAKALNAYEVLLYRNLVLTQDGFDALRELSTHE